MLTKYKAICDELLKETETSLQHVGEIDGIYNIVAQKTSELHQMCEGLLAEEVVPVFVFCCNVGIS